MASELATAKAAQCWCHETTKHLVMEPALCTVIADTIDALLAAEREAGQIEGVTEYAWWKDGKQYVGTCGTTLERAIAAIRGVKG